MDALAFPPLRVPLGKGVSLLTGSLWHETKVKIRYDYKLLKVYSYILTY